MLELLSEIFAQMSLEGIIYFRSRLSAPWGVDIERRQDSIRFHYVRHGLCYFRMGAHSPPIRLEPKSLILVPHGASHILTSPDCAPQNAVSMNQMAYGSHAGSVRYIRNADNLDDADCRLISGYFRHADQVQHALIRKLPPFIHVPRYGDMSGKWIENSLRLMNFEGGEQGEGEKLIARKLSEVILAQAVRAHFESSMANHGPFKGYGDCNLLRALSAYHRDPSRNWSLAELAEEAGLSRTVFATRFKEKLGTTPRSYMTAWRMQIARRVLREKGATIAQAAEACGYKSESAFSRAFLLDTGCRPACYRKQNMVAI